MKLGELILQYRTQHSMSQRKFAERSGLSSGYITMLEKGRQPTTGRPIVPTMETLSKIAVAMGITLEEICSALDDDFVVRLGEDGEDWLDSEDDTRLLALFRLLPDDQKERILDSIEFSLRSQGLLQ